MDQIQGALPTRAEIPAAYRWKLEDLYTSSEAWAADLKMVETLANEFVSYQGKIGASAETFRGVLALRDRLSRLMDKTFVYAKMKRDQDNTDSQSQALVERAQGLAVRL
mgnify:FL=1